LFFGVSFGDEAIQIAIPYRFLLGDRPFLDEHNLIQSAHFISYPFFNAYYRIFGNIEGIVWFGRLLYLAFSLAVARVVFLGLRQNVGSEAATLISTVVILFVPAAIPNLTYNTLSSLFFTAGIYVTLRGSRPYRIVTAGVLHALAVVALPSYGFPVLVFTGVFVYTLAGERKKIGYYFLGLVLGVLSVLPAFGHFHLENLTFASRYVGGTSRGLQKIALVFRDLWDCLPLKILLLPLIVAFPFVWKKRDPRIATIYFIIFPLLLWRDRTWTASLYFIFGLGILAPAFLKVIESDLFARTLFFRAWIPAAAAAFIAAWTSTSLSINAGFGMLPGTLATLALAVLVARQLPRVNEKVPQPHTILLALVLITLAMYQSTLYREDPLLQLRHRISGGPFRGIYTSQEKATFLQRLTGDLKEFSRPEGHILFYYQFPAGYLLTPMRPAATNAWSISCPPLDYPNCVSEFKRDLGRFVDGATVLVKVKNLYHNAHDIADWGDGPVDEWIESRYRRVLATEKYEIYLDR